jgi:hypothetical protein
MLWSLNQTLNSTEAKHRVPSRWPACKQPAEEEAKLLNCWNWRFPFCAIISPEGIVLHIVNFLSLLNLQFYLFNLFYSFLMQQKCTRPCFELKSQNLKFYRHIWEFSSHISGIFCLKTNHPPLTLRFHTTYYPPLMPFKRWHIGWKGIT